MTESEATRAAKAMPAFGKDEAGNSLPLLLLRRLKLNWVHELAALRQMVGWAVPTKNIGRWWAQPTLRNSNDCRHRWTRRGGKEQHRPPPGGTAGVPVPRYRRDVPGRGPGGDSTGIRSKRRRKNRPAGGVAVDRDAARADDSQRRGCLDSDPHERSFRGRLSGG